MRNNREYQICRDIATYLRLKYPNIIFHFDLAGLNLSRAQAGMMKSIQGSRGWPDLFIAYAHLEKIGEDQAKLWHGLFIEVKKENTVLYKTNGEPKTDHIKEQIECLNNLEKYGYKTHFGIGFDDCKKIIDEYLS
jgi:hypothetical protein